MPGKKGHLKQFTQPWCRILKAVNNHMKNPQTLEDFHVNKTWRFVIRFMNFSTNDKWLDPLDLSPDFIGQLNFLIRARSPKTKIKGVRKHVNPPETCKTSIQK